VLTLLVAVAEQVQAALGELDPPLQGDYPVLLDRLCAESYALLRDDTRLASGFEG
jgi:hypothetical protein